MGAVYRESRRTLRKCTLICKANQSTILLAETAGTVSDAVGYSGSRVRMQYHLVKKIQKKENIVKYKKRSIFEKKHD